MVFFFTLNLVGWIREAHQGLCAGVQLVEAHLQTLLADLCVCVFVCVCKREKEGEGGS